MKEKKKILAFILLFSSIFLLPFTVKADSNVYLDISPLEIGDDLENTINRSGGLSDTENYVLSLSLHNDTDNVIVKPQTSIKKNKLYTLNVRVDAREGNLPNDFLLNLSSYDSSDFYVSKTEPVITESSYEFQIKYNTRMQKNTIYGHLDLENFARPVVGKKVVYKTLNENDEQKALYKVEQGWYLQNSSFKLTTNDIFEPGKIYEYRLVVTPVEGYNFSDHLVLDDYSIAASGYWRGELEVIRTNKKIEKVYTFDTSQTENTIYGPIDIPAPTIVIGEEIKTVVSTDPRYDIIGSWKCFDDENLEYVDIQPGDVFESGKSYYYNFYLEGNDDWVMEMNIELTMSTLPSNPNYNFYNYGTNGGGIYVVFNNNSINGIYNINTYDSTPKVGKTPKPISIYTYSDGEVNHYDIEEQQWYDGDTPMANNQTFVKDHTYKLVAKYVAEEGYVFSKYIEDNDFYFAGDFFRGVDVDRPNNREIIVTYNFNIEYLDNVIYESGVLNMAEPTIGGTYSLASTLSQEYSIISQKWYNETDHKEMANTDKFEADKVYKYVIRLNANGDKRFSTDFELEAANIENSPYLDKENRMYQLGDFMGGVGAFTPSEYSTSVIFVMSNKLNDESYALGYVNLEPAIVTPRAGGKISYNNAEISYYLTHYKDKGIKFEMGWYEAGSDKILPEGATFETNKSYELHIRYSAINSNKILPKAIVDIDSEYQSYTTNPYYKGTTRKYTNNSTEFVLAYEMPDKTYEQDNTIIKSIDVDEVVKPTAGENVVKNIPTEGEKYTISEKWYVMTSFDSREEIDTDHVFENNNMYYHEIEFTKKDGYKWSDSIAYNIDQTDTEGFYCQINEQKDKYLCSLTYYVEEEEEPDPDMLEQGNIKFKDHQYQTSSSAYSIPDGVDEITLEVAEKTGEYDLYFNYYDAIETRNLEYDIDGDTLVISNINKFRQANPKCSNISISITVDENDQYSEAYKYFALNFDSGSKAVVLPTVTDYIGVADGKPHTIGVTGGSGGTIVYSLSENGPWQTGKPQITTGTAKIYVKVDPDPGYTALLPTYGTVTLRVNSEKRNIIFHSNDGNNKTKTQSAFIGESVKLLKNTFTREGYEFVKWTTNADGSGKSLVDEDYTTIDGNTNLYAQWREIFPDDWNVGYKTHVQSYGWQGRKYDGVMSGTSGEAKRLEAIEIKLNSDKYVGDILYRTHIQTYGWESSFKKNDEMSGTSGEAKRLEAIEIKLDGEVAENYDVYYRVHAQTFGWLGWAKNGESAGTAGYAYRLEGIEIKIVPKGEIVDGYGTVDAFRDKYGVASVTFNKANYILETGETTTIKATVIPGNATNKTLTWTSSNEAIATVDNDGKVTAVSVGDATITATSVNGKKAECSISVTEPLPGVGYKTHVQSYGWQDYVSNGMVSGTVGEAKRLEAIQIKLKNQPYTGNIEYRTHIQKNGWETSFKKNDEMSGTSGEAKRLEAIEIKLTGQMEENYDIYYRVHAQSFGWLAWAKNGEKSGTAGYAKRLEGIEVILLAKGEQPPIRTNQNDARAYIEK